jgi:threonyl-tRNA synthetase
MFPPMSLDEGESYYLKPMNCPFHNLIFRSRQRSYRELPLRMFEFGTVYRYEKSGVIHGLTRVRGLTQDDSHIYCTPEQMQDELTSLLDFVLDLLRDYGLSDFFLELSTKPEEKFIGSDEDWNTAIEALRAAAKTKKLDLIMDEGGGAFYGPKISVQARDAIGRTWQLSTIQVDFNQPKRFGLEYVAADGTRKQPVMIHRALFGSVERFFAILVEHYAGAFPLWMAPVQCAIVPVQDDSPEVIEACKGLQAQLTSSGLRAKLDDKPGERMQARIREAERMKIPYIVVIGKRDVEKGDSVFNIRDTRRGTQSSMSVDELVNQMTTEVENRVVVGES